MAGNSLSSFKKKHSVAQRTEQKFILFVYTFSTMSHNCHWVTADSSFVDARGSGCVSSDRPDADSSMTCRRWCRDPPNADPPAVHRLTPPHHCYNTTSPDSGRPASPEETRLRRLPSFRCDDVDHCRPLPPPRLPPRRGSHCCGTSRDGGYHYGPLTAGCCCAVGGGFSAVVAVPPTPRRIGQRDD